MINCYKILEIPDFADDEVIQRAYRNLAKKYHPDVSDIPNTEEKFKLIAKAYSILSNPVSKQYHDLKLRTPFVGHTSKQSAPSQPSSSSETIAQKMRRWAEIEKQNDLAYYEYENQKFPLKYRVVGWFVGSLFGWILAYVNWFSEDLNNLYMLPTLGIFLIFFCSVGVLSSSFKRLRFLHLTKRYNPNFELISYARGVGLFVGLVVLLLAVVNFQSYYHLKKYPVYCYASWVKPTNFDFTIEVSYRPENWSKDIVKEKELKPEYVVDLKNNRILIKYSHKNPRIMEVVCHADYADFSPTN
ncbi:MAG: DnaJ domain-containing protein [Flavobacteriales bacterium]|nr:DnaJ domain-containing protein [Flavobacteriales bacterium]